MPQSILVVSNVFPPQVLGGAEVVAQRQAAALSRRGFEVSVLAGRLDGTAGSPGWTSLANEGGLRVFRFGLQPSGPETNFVSSDANEHFRQVLHAVRPDIVHFHNLPWLGAGLLSIARSTGARSLVTLHDTWGFCLRQTRLRDGLEVCENFAECDVCLASVSGSYGERVPIRLRRDFVRWCLEHAEGLLFPSRSLRDSYARAGLPTQLFTHVSNGVDLAAFPSQRREPHNEVRFLCASSLEEHKGVRVLWDALHLLLQDRRLAGRWSMVLAGDGSLAPELRARFEAGTLRAPVVGVGNVSRQEMATLYARADVVVLASICPENEPVSLMEAIASGAAQIGTRIGGIPELIEEGRTGALVPPGDPAALAQAMRRLILDPALVQAYSAGNIARRADFDENRSIDKLVSLFTRPARPPDGLDRKVVLCTGSVTDADAGSATSVRLRSLDDRLRLLWHDWVGSSVWDQADLLCLFSEQLPFGALGRAIRSRIPIVAPRTASLGDVPGLQGLVHEYGSMAEALDLVENLTYGLKHTHT